MSECHGYTLKTFFSCVGCTVQMELCTLWAMQRVFPVILIILLFKGVYKMGCEAIWGSLKFLLLKFDN